MKIGIDLSWQVEVHAQGAGLPGVRWQKYNSHVASFSQVVHIESFINAINILPTKTKPKKLVYMGLLFIRWSHG